MLGTTFLVSGLCFLQDIRRYFCNEVGVRKFFLRLLDLSG